MAAQTLDGTRDNLKQMSSHNLPKFKNPPVVETVLGVQFDPLPKFCNAHLGAFWQSLGSDWPNVSDVPSLDPQFERFGEGKTWQAAGFQLRLSQELNTRLQIRNRSNDRMIQVQDGRLHYNWLGLDDGEYPTYEKVKPEFDWVLGVFQQFVAGESLGELLPNQWEVTYVNHIPKGTVWNEPHDWMGLLQSFAGLPAKKRSIRLESFGGEWHYEIQPQRGRLHVNLAHGLRKKPVEQQVLVLNLTARGPVKHRDQPGPTLDEGLCIGHETIVRAFKDLTSDKAHEYWELING